jgi:hypothetical protein
LVFELIFSLALVAILAWWYSLHIRYFLLRLRAKGWPTAAATLQRGAMGRIPVGEGGWIPAAFLGYSFLVVGMRYAGFFVLLGSEDAAGAMLRNLPGQVIHVHYKPSDPNVSLLLQFDDPRFSGVKATQNPDSLSNCPSFDLQDAMR